MTAGWPCTALRAPLPDATPEPGADDSTKPLEKNRSFIRSLDLSRNSSRHSLQKPSRLFVAVIRSFKPSHKFHLKNLLDEGLLGGKTRLTLADADDARSLRKGVSTGADRRYIHGHPRASRHIQGVNPMTRYTPMPGNAAGGDI